MSAGEISPHAALYVLMRAKAARREQLSKYVRAARLCGDRGAVRSFRRAMRTHIESR